MQPYGSKGYERIRRGLRDDLFLGANAGAALLQANVAGHIRLKSSGRTG